MGYTVGSQHVLSGSGSVALASPIGLRIALSGIPAWAGADDGPPPAYVGLGTLVVGNADGTLPPIRVEHELQLVYPLPDTLDTLHYGLVAGLTATVDELLADPANVTMQPFDRNPTAWAGGTTTQTLAAGTALYTIWTYTVPAGRCLYVSSSTCVMWRSAVNTAPGLVQAGIEVDGQRLAKVELYQNVIGAYERAAPLAGVILRPGQILQGICGNTDTGGSVRAHVVAAGYTFDA